VTNKDGNESLFRKFGDKTTPCIFSEKQKPLLQSSESLKSRIPNTSLEQLAILAFSLTYTGSMLANLFERFDVFLTVHHSIDFYQITNLMHTSFIL